MIDLTVWLIIKWRQLTRLSAWFDLSTSCVDSMCMFNRQQTHTHTAGPHRDLWPSGRRYMLHMLLPKFLFWNPKNRGFPLVCATHLNSGVECLLKATSTRKRNSGRMLHGEVINSRLQWKRGEELLTRFLLESCESHSTATTEQRRKRVKICSAMVQVEQVVSV